MKIFLPTYIDKTRRLFEKVKVVEYFQQHSVIQYSIRVLIVIIHLQQHASRLEERLTFGFQDIVAGICIKKEYDKKVKMRFKYYKFTKYVDMCCFCEVKLLFDEKELD